MYFGNWLVAARRCWWGKKALTQAIATEPFFILGLMPAIRRSLRGRWKLGISD
jgi:hypothetical protein